MTKRAKPPAPGGAPAGAPEARLALPTRAELVEMVSGDAESIRLTGEFLPGVVVQSNDDFRKVSGVLLSIKSALNEITERRDRIVNPIKLGLANIEELFAPSIKAFTLFEGVVKEKLAAWNLLVEGAREADAMAGRPVALAPPEADGITIVARWDFEVVDPAAVPREFCAPDTKKIRAAVAAGRRDIPGVRAFRDDTVRVSTKGTP